MASEPIYLNRERIRARGDKPMTGGEKLTEVEWLLDAGVHPDHVAAQLGTTVDALVKLARDHGQAGLGRRTSAEQIRHDRDTGQGARKRAA